MLVVAVTAATNDCRAPICVVVDAGVTATDAIDVATTVTGAVADFVGSIALVATTWHVPEGTVAGAV